MRYLLVLALVAGCSHAHDTTPAPDAQVTTSKGTQVALADSWKGHAHTVVVFYRGFY